MPNLLLCTPQIGVPDSLFDEMEEKYAPPDHEVFQLTPPPFDSRANKYYEEMGQPPVSSNSFWNVYQELLAHFQGAEPSDDLTEVLSDLEKRTEQIAKEKVDVLPGLKPLRAGVNVTVVGDGVVNDGHGNDSEIEATMTTSEEEEGNEAGPSGPCTFAASMTPSESSTGTTHHDPTRTRSAPTFVASMTPSETSIRPTRSRTIHSTRRTRSHTHNHRT